MIGSVCDLKSEISDLNFEGFVHGCIDAAIRQILIGITNLHCKRKREKGTHQKINENC